ncbi:MAG: hypothetical protein AB7G11_13580 [Phycisphaerales bacterium]
MSQKWIRSKKWDDEHIPGWAWPLKALLRAFSSIPLAVVLLIGVSLYGTLASVPIGLIALAPTYFLYALTLVLTIGVVAVLPIRGAAVLLRHAGVSRAARFGVVFLGAIVLGLAATYLWARFAWPAMRYSEATGSGVRLFSDFVARNKAVTVRRLPGMEMSELEFYAWWPLKVLLVAFVLNMVVATVRRIEFSFPYIGVLTVHSGIVVLALGSMYYSSLKQEGDVLLLSGATGADGNPTPGAPVKGFYDNTRVALWVADETTWRQLALTGVPRYHDYNLNALGASGMDDWARQFDEGRTLDRAIPVPPADPASPSAADPFDGLSFRLVGYAPYADVALQWMPASPAEVAALTSPAIPVRNVEMVISTGPDSSRVNDRTQLFPTIPAGRVQQIGLGMTLEYTSGMSAQRWADLNTPAPAGSAHSLIVEVPGAGVSATRQVVALGEGSSHEIAGTGYTVETVRLIPSLQQLLAKTADLPIGIADPLYAGADTSVAVVKISPPPSTDPAAPSESYIRFVYSRFPEKSIDIYQVSRGSGEPASGSLGKREADPSIRLSYLDDSSPHYYIDEVVGESSDPGNPVLRGVMRPKVRPESGGGGGGGGSGAGSSASSPVTLEGLKPGYVIPLGPVAGLRVAERWAHAVPVEMPMPVPANQRDNKELGTHKHAAIAVEIRHDGTSGDVDWKQVVWLPFIQYVMSDQQNVREVRLPTGKRLQLAFGRVMRPLPDLQLQLADFRMFSHAFGGPTQDFRSDLVVIHGAGAKQKIDLRYTSLNDPLLVRVPYKPVAGRSTIENVLGWAISFIAPTQYKFSQAGWDPDGWNATQAEVDQGKRPRALARYTILGVGNNPGIYVIATGAVMMVVGIPWAFYVKPYIMKRRKKRVQMQHAAKPLAKHPIVAADAVEVNA